MATDPPLTQAERIQHSYSAFMIVLMGPAFPQIHSYKNFIDTAVQTYKNKAEKLAY